MNTATAQASQVAPRPQRARLSRAERNRLIVETLPLVGYLVSDIHAKASHVSRDDLASAAALALVTAADAFDPTLGVPFSGYARRRILGAIADEMRSMDWATRLQRRRINSMKQARETLLATLGRTPTTGELAQTLGVSVREVLEAKTLEGHTVTSIHEFDDEALEVEDTTAIRPDRAAAQAEERELLQAALEALPVKMRHIVQAVYFDDKTVQDVAAELGVSHSAVSQQRSEALRLMHDAIRRVYPREDGSPAAPTSRMSAATREAYIQRVADINKRFAPHLHTAA